MLTPDNDPPPHSFNPLAPLKTLISNLRESSQFPAMASALKTANKIANNGISLYDSITRFESEIDHPNKRSIFLTLATPISTASSQEVAFLLNRTAEQARGGGQGEKFVAGAVRTLLAKQETDLETKAKLFIEATDFFERSESYTEALGTCLLASKLVAEPASSIFKERGKTILIKNTLELEQFGLGFNAVIRLQSMFGTLLEFGVLSKQEIAGLNLYMNKFFQNFA